MANPFSIASYSFHGLHARQAMTVFQYLETVKYRYHMATADIWNGMFAGYDEAYLRLLRQQLDERELTLVNLCCDGAHLWNRDPAEEAKCDELADKCLLAAEILGAKTIRLDWGVREAEASDEQIERTARKFEAYCARAASFGAKLGPENHWGASTNAASLRKLFQAVRADNFGMLLHLGNWRESQPNDAASALAYHVEFAPKAFHTHLSYDVCREAEVQLPPLQAAGYAGSWSVESHLGTNEYANVACQLAQIKRVLAPCDYRKG